MLAELKRVAKALGKIPTRQEFDKQSEISSETLAKRFKGWKNALSSAGFDPLKLRIKYQDSEMIEELKRVANQLGRTPSCTEFGQLSSFSSSTVSRRFEGSWKKACQEAGLKPFRSIKPPNIRGGWNKGQRKLMIQRDELLYLYNGEGKSASAIARQLGVSLNTVLRTMKEYNIEVKKLHYSMPRETSIEEAMYAELERRGVTFVKQQVIDGLWVVDALIPGVRLVIECDGEYWHSRPEMVKRDRKKDAYLRSRGYKVFRFPEAAILADVTQCVNKIVEELVNHYNKNK